jgi:glycosyltransferase involved in cell wall biosynthesis
MILAIVRICALQLKLLRAAQTTNAHVYCSNDFDTLLIGVLSARFDRKLVYDSHELWTDMLIGVPPFFKSVLRQVEKRLIKRANVVATVNEFIARELRSRYSLHRPVQVVYNYPNLPVTKTQMRTPHTMKRVLYQGRYSPERGLENLVRASEYLLPDIELVFRGYDEIEKNLRELASGRMNVRFEKPVEMHRLVQAAQTADVGVVSYMPTNLCNYLASPNKLFEYIRAGLAVAASDMPFLRKIVLRDDIGVLFDPRNPRSIADALNLVTRPATLERCRNNAASVACKYTWQSESEKLVQLYEDLVNQTS